MIIALSAIGGVALTLIALGIYAKYFHWRSKHSFGSGVIKGARIGMEVARKQEEREALLRSEVPHIEEDEPRAVDPDNPPRMVTYKPRSAASYVECTCHGNRLHPGDQVMLWPIPDHPEGGMDILCQAKIREAGA